MIRTCRCFFVLPALLLAGATTAADIYVASSGNNTTGSDWDTAITSIQAALDAAQPGDTINIKGETFLTTAQLTWTKPTLIIRGGFAGNTVGGLPGERDIGQWPTVIQRESASLFRILKATSVKDSVLEGVTLRNGQTDERDAGAGMHITFCSNLVVRASVIEGNTAANAQGNLGNLIGGGIYISNSWAIISNCLIIANSNKTLYGSTVSHALGGGIAALTGAVIISECLIQDNMLVAARNAYGSGVYLNNGDHRIEHCVFKGNFSPVSQGGPTYNRGDGLHVEGTACKTFLFNSLVIGNHRDGVHLNSGALNIMNCTITAHGRFGVNRAAGSLAVTNSILWQNTYDVSGAVVLAHSVVGSGMGNTTNGVTTANPLFARGLYLNSESPAINAGSCTASECGLADRTTSTNASLDTGIADMGYHFRPGPAASAADSLAQFHPDKAEFFVATTGNNSNPGTEAAPFRSITHALSQAASGTRLHIAPGLYTKDTETFPLVLTKPGIRILGSGANTTVIDAKDANQRVLSARCAVGDCMMTDITFSGGNVPKTNASEGAGAMLPYNAEAFWQTRRGAGLKLANCAMDFSDVVIAGNTLRGALNENIMGGGLFALWSWGVMSNLTVISNVLTDGQSNTGEGHGGGLYLNEGKWQITHSLIASNLAGFGNYGGNFGGGAYIVGPHTMAFSRVQGNRLAGSGTAVRRGAGLFLNQGLVQDCRILTNTMTSTTSTNANGGGVFLFSGALRNCLVAENAAIFNGGGIYAMSNAATIESLTVAANHSVEAATIAGVYLVADAPAQITDCIFAHNYNDFDIQDMSVSDSGGTFSYSCTRPARTGLGNVDDDPGFINAHNDFRLAPGAPTIDTALEQDWMTGAIDIDGNQRIRNGIPDMGAFEAPGPNDGPFQTAFAGAPLFGMDSLEVVFSATVQGSNTSGVVYYWDFDDNGVFDVSGPDKQTVTNTYPPGRFSVRLFAKNAVAESYEYARSNYVFVSPSTIYVSTKGNHTDGTTWARAFTNIQPALNAAIQNNTLCLEGGTHWVQDELTWSSQNNVSILGGFEGVGFPGARDPALWPTTLRRNPAAGNFRIFRIININNGLLSGVVLADGYTTAASAQPVAPGSGGAINMLASSMTIEDCIFTNNQCRTSGNSHIWGGAIYANSCVLLLRRCLFAGNLAYGGPVGSANNRALGGALATDNSTTTILDNLFLANTADAGGNNGSLGGALYLSGSASLVRNTLLAFNRAGPNRPRAQGGAMVMDANTTLENVTVVSNSVWNDGSTFAVTAGGICAAGGRACNVLAYHNTLRTTDAASDVYAPNLNIFSNSCASELNAQGDNNTAANPRFADLQAGDFTPMAASPCRNRGFNQDWMIGAADLAGRSRILTGRVDMGAYEIPPPYGVVMRLR